MRESIHQRIRAPENAKAIQMGRRAGYKTGGAVPPKTKEAVHKHEEHDHPGKAKTRLKRGGTASGKKPAERLDKRPRKALGGSMPWGGGAPAPAPMAPSAAPARGMVMNQAKKGGKVERAKGGQVPAMKMKPAPMETTAKRAAGGRVRHGKTNIIIHAGGGGQNPMALQQAHQQGEQAGAAKVVGALKAKMGGAGGPPGAPPMGAAPPMGGGAPPGAGVPPMGPPMRAHGGKVVSVKKHTRRCSGGRVD